MTSSPSLHSFFFLPSWWVRAYEGMSTAGEEEDVSALVQRGGLMPPLSVTELNSLAILLTKVQKSIRAGEQTVRLDGDDHRKTNPSSSPKSAFPFERMMYLLSSLRLFGSGGRLLGLVEAEVGFDGQSLELKLGDFGKQAFLGYGEAYTIRGYQILDQLPIEQMFQGGAPLVVAQSAWLDLQAREQFLMLKLEKSVQWQQNLLSLGGCYGLELDFLDLLQSSSRMSVFMGMIQRLQRLGARLVEHGALQEMEEKPYLALSDELRPQLIFQVFPHRLASIQARYLEEGENVLRQVFEANLERTLRWIGIPRDGFGKAQSIWKEVKKISSSLGPSRSLAHSDGVVLLGEAFFWEWCCRCHITNTPPLPSEWAQSQLTQMVLSEQKSIAERMQEVFCYLEDRRDLMDELWQTPGALLASEASRDFVENLGAYTKREETLRPSPPPPPAPSATKRQNAVSHLEAMRSSDPDRYKALKKAYLSSLDAASARTVAEFQKLLQPSAFEGHIRHSLVKYMLEHPDEWIQ